MKLEDLINEYKKVYYTDDDEAIALVTANIVGCMLDTPPTWLYLIGPSSGGKSALIEVFDKVKHVTRVADLTPNTFLSAMGSTNGQETSLLKKLGLKFVVTMKDFTTLLSKNDTDKTAILAQMREIYDGHFAKDAGNGKHVAWGEPNKGKATFIMACTEEIYAIQDDAAGMGTRAVSYVLKPQDRVKMTKQALRNNNKLLGNVAHLQELFKEFVERKMDECPAELPPIPEDLEDDIIAVANFASLSRSVVKRDYKGAKTLALSAEMPTRMAKQLLSIAQLLTYINEGVLTEKYRKLVFKVAYDCISKQRRMTLEVLAKYNRINRSGAADYLNFPPERAQEWLEDLNMFRMCERIKAKEKQYWRMPVDFRQVMIKYFGVTPEDKDLEGEEGGDQSAVGYYSDMPPDISYEEEERKMAEVTQAEVDFNNIGP